MSMQLKALIAMCAAAAMVCLVAVTRWMQVRDERAAIQQQAQVQEARAARALRPPVVAPQPVAEAEILEEPVVASATLFALPEASATALVVEVTSDGAALAAARVECLAETGRVVASAQTASSGEARCEGVAAGRYIVRVETRSGQWASQRVEVGKGEARALLQLGSAQVSGRVWDREGRVAVDAPLLVRQLAADGAEVWREVRTGNDGRYECEGLAAGDTRVEDGDHSVPRVVQLVLAAGERQRADLGQPDGRFEWRGRLVTASGQHVDEPLELQLLENQRGWSARIQCGPDGSFATRLRTGDWVAMASGIDGSFEVARVGLRDGDVVQDAVLGTCLRAQLLMPAERDGEFEVAVALRREDSDDVRELTPRGGRLFVAGLQPGRWRVDARRTGLEPDAGRERELSMLEGALLDTELDVAWDETP